MIIDINWLNYYWEKIIFYKKLNINNPFIKTFKYFEVERDKFDLEWTMNFWIICEMEIKSFTRIKI